MAHKAGRPPNNRPATWYDYRRAIFLVQHLARIDSDKWPEYLSKLADGWDIAHDGTLEDMLKQIAQHALEHGNQEWKGE